MQYDSNNNALTLGDDDSIAVGDYSIQYNSTDDEWQAVHPNDEISSIPRSTSGSLVPRGLAESVSEGKALADNGEMYDSVQTAVDNASGWVFVGPGTFNESVTINTDGLTLEGAGYDSLIDGGTIGDAISLDASNVSILNLSINTTSGSGNNGIKTVSSVDNITIDSVTIDECGSRAIYLDVGDNHTVTNCRIDSTDNTSIRCGGNGCIVSGCTSISAGNDAIVFSGDDHICVNCTVFDTTGDGNQGITLLCDDSLVGGCRVHNSGDRGIAVITSTGGGNDNIIFNNRVSDSTNQDINDNGSGNILDDNLTGPSN